MNELQQPTRNSEIGNIEHRTSNAERRTVASILSWIKHFFDYLSASREEPPPGADFLASPLWVGIWWGLMIGLILLFCGQTSKFIYIDF
jgi:hypothetical protein